MYDRASLWSCSLQYLDEKNTGSVGNVVNTNVWKYTTENLIHRISSHKKLEYSHATFHDMWNNIFFSIYNLSPGHR